MKGIIKLEEKEIASSGCLKYVGSIFQSCVVTQEDMNHRIKCGGKNGERLLE